MSCITTKIKNKKITLCIIVLIVFIALMINTDTAAGKNDNAKATATVINNTVENVTDIHTQTPHISKKIKKEAKQHEQVLKEVSHWKSLGYVRCTEYCPSCNSPSGYTSSSGVSLYEGCVACSWLDVGTKIRIDGIEYTVVDICGTDAIDIFVDSSGCYCNMNTYKKVEIYVP